MRTDKAFELATTSTEMLLKELSRRSQACIYISAGLLMNDARGAVHLFQRGPNEALEELALMLRAMWEEEDERED